MEHHHNSHKSQPIHQNNTQPRPRAQRPAPKAPRPQGHARSASRRRRPARRAMRAAHRAEGAPPAGPCAQRIAPKAPRPEGHARSASRRRRLAGDKGGPGPRGRPWDRSRPTTRSKPPPPTPTRDRRPRTPPPTTPFSVKFLCQHSMRTKRPDTGIGYACVLSFFQIPGCLICTCTVTAWPCTVHRRRIDI
jgi:hypothetical protein